MSLRVHEKDEEPFESNPATIHGHKLPANCVESDWIDVVGKEQANLAKDLLNTNSTGSDVIWEEFDEEGWKTRQTEIEGRIKGNLLYVKALFPRL